MRCLEHAPSDLIAEAKAMTFPAKRRWDVMTVRYFRLRLDKQINAE